MDKPTGTLQMYREDGDLHQPRLDERAAPSSREDYILKAGLASNQDKLNYYRRVLKDPNRAAQDPQLRAYAGDLLNKLLHILFTDTVVWNRTKTVLTRDRKNVRGLREDVSDSGLRSLIEKAERHECPLEVVLEVYSRGAENDGERGGFGRVNSFLAGGLAVRMDADLIEEPVPEGRQKSKTLSTVKRVLKEKAR